MPTPISEQPQRAIRVPRMTIEEKLKELERRNTKADLGGGQKRIDQQHAKGKMTGNIPL